MSKPPSKPSFFDSIASNITKFFDASTLSCTKNSSSSTKEVSSASLASSHLCTIHMNAYSHFCIACEKNFCFICASEHLSTNHDVLDYKEIPKYIEKKANGLLSMIETTLEDSNEHNLPDYKSEIEEGLALLRKDRENLHRLVDDYFDSLDQEYKIMFECVPSIYKAYKIKSSINSLKNSIANYAKLTSIPLSSSSINSASSSLPPPSNSSNLLPILRQFLGENLEGSAKGLLQEYSNLMASSLQNKRVPLPQISSQMGDIVKLKNFLQNSVNIVPPTIGPYDQLKKLRISTTDFFLPEFGALIPYIDDLTSQLHLYNLQKQSTECYNLNILSSYQDIHEIPSEHSILITPKLDVFISGGILKNGRLSNTFFVCNGNGDLHEPMQSSKVPILGLPLQGLKPMKEERAAHAMVYLKNWIYIIGGKTQGKSDKGTRKTARCERYDIIGEKWEDIPSMKCARSRAGVTVFDDKFIYVFWGGEEGDGERGDEVCSLVERFSIEGGRWEIVGIKNFGGVSPINFVSAVQINQNQILLFGGFQDAKSPLYNKGGAIYNVKDENIVNLGEIFGSPIFQSYPPFVQEGKVYLTSYIFKNEKGMMRMPDADLVLRIENNGVQCKDVFLYK